MIPTWPKPTPLAVPADQIRRLAQAPCIDPASSSEAFGLWLRIWRVRLVPSGGGVQLERLEVIEVVPAEREGHPDGGGFQRAFVSARSPSAPDACGTGQ